MANTLGWTKTGEANSNTLVGRDLRKQGTKVKTVEKKKPKLGWVVKDDEGVGTERKKKDAAAVEPRKYRFTTGMLAPTIIAGGVNLHARHPVEWDVELFKGAILNGAFTSFNLPTGDDLKSKILSVMADLVATNTEGGQLPEGVAPSAAPNCVIGTPSAAQRAINHQIEHGVAYTLSCFAMMDQQGLNALLAVNQEDLQLVQLVWSGPLQHGDLAMEFVLSVPPHILVEDGPVGVARAVILRHDGSLPQYVAKENNTVGAYAMAPRETFTHTPFVIANPAVIETGTTGRFDLDFIFDGAAPWKLLITRVE